MKNLYSSKIIFSAILCLLAVYHATAQSQIQQQGYFGAYFADSTLFRAPYTYLGSSATSGDTATLVFEVHDFPIGPGLFPHRTGVEYAGSYWYVATEDNNDSIPAAMGFDIFVPTHHGTSFRCTKASSDGTNYLDMSNAATSNNPGALVFVTYDIGVITSGAGIYYDAPVGVWYDADSVNNPRWAVLDERISAPMPGGITFNVFVADTTGGRAFIQTATAANINRDATIISSPYTDNNPDAVLIVTHNITASGYATDTIPYGVTYDGTNWRIYHETVAPMQPGTAFNVLVASAPDVSTGVNTVAAGDMKLIAYPNPSSDHIGIQYAVTASTDVTIQLYDMDGRLMETIYQGKQSMGSYSISKCISDLSDGVYYLLLREGENSTHLVVTINK